MNNSEILEWLEKYDWHFNKDKYHIHNGMIDVVGYVWINSSCESLPYKFGNVSEWFSIGECTIKSLENCPEYVGGDFDCNGTNIKSLKGIPRVIGGNIYFELCKHLEDISDVWNVTFLSDELMLCKTISFPKVADEYSEWLRYISTIQTVELYENYFLKKSFHKL